VEQSLFEKFGGRDGIKHVVDTFYKAVLADDTVNHYFQETNMQK